MHLADVRVAGARCARRRPGRRAVAGRRARRRRCRHRPGTGRCARSRPSVVEQALRTVLDVAPAGARVVHCCAADVPIALLRAAGADAISRRRRRCSARPALRRARRGRRRRRVALAGRACRRPTPGRPSRRTGADRRAVARRSAFRPSRSPRSVVPTPACGLAGASPGLRPRAPLPNSRASVGAVTLSREEGADALERRSPGRRTSTTAGPPPAGDAVAPNGRSERLAR